jgi:hypothetical protein
VPFGTAPRWRWSISRDADQLIFFWAAWVIYAIRHCPSRKSRTTESSLHREYSLFCIGSGVPRLSR